MALVNSGTAAVLQMWIVRLLAPEADTQVPPWQPMSCQATVTRSHSTRIVLTLLPEKICIRQKLTNVVRVGGIKPGSQSFTQGTSPRLSMFRHHCGPQFRQIRLAHPSWKQRLGKAAKCLRNCGSGWVPDHGGLQVTGGVLIAGRADEWDVALEVASEAAHENDVTLACSPSHGRKDER